MPWRRTLCLFLSKTEYRWLVFWLDSSFLVYCDDTSVPGPCATSLAPGAAYTYPHHQPGHPDTAQRDAQGTVSLTTHKLFVHDSGNSVVRSSTGWRYCNDLRLMNYAPFALQSFEATQGRITMCFWAIWVLLGANPCCPTIGCTNIVWRYGACFLLGAGPASDRCD